MIPKEPDDDGQFDAFRSRLDQIIDMKHPRVVLANTIDWDFLAAKCGENYSDKPLSICFAIAVCRWSKSHKPYEFGVKVSVATTLNRSKGGQFAIHAKALPGKPYDGHTIEIVLPDIEDTTLKWSTSSRSLPPANEGV